MDNTLQEVEFITKFDHSQSELLDSKQIDAIVDGWLDHHYGIVRMYSFNDDYGKWHEKNNKKSLEEKLLQDQVVIKFVGVVKK